MDLPLPLMPTMEAKVPSATEKLTSFTAVTGSAELVKVLVKWEMVIMTTLLGALLRDGPWR